MNIYKRNKIKMKTIFLIFLFFLLFNMQYSLPFFSNDFKSENATGPKTIYIFGHKNPDTDAIASSIVLADYLKRIGRTDNLIPCRLGELNKETKYALNYFNAETPKLITNVSESDEVILVDHNDASQSIDSENANYVGLIDHHAITGFVTTNPVKVIANNVGCACTIIYQLYRNNNITITNKMAGLMLSAIISDTLLLKSTITTTDDITAVQNLSEICGINYTKYGFDMLLAGTDFSDFSEYYIITFDSKAYVVNGYPIQIASVQTANVSEILERKTKLLEEIDKYNKDNNKELFVLTIVDIINMDSTLLVRGNLSSSVETAFNGTLEDSQLFVKGKVARKKDIYPPIANAINKLSPGSYISEDSAKSSSSNNETFERFEQNSDTYISNYIGLNILLILTLLLN